MSTRRRPQSRLAPVVAALLAITLTSNAAVLAAEQLRPDVRAAAVTQTTAAAADTVSVFGLRPGVAEAASRARAQTLQIRAGLRQEHEERRQEAEKRTLAETQEAAERAAEKAAAAADADREAQQPAVEPQAGGASSPSPTQSTAAPSRGSHSSPGGGAATPQPAPSPTREPAPTCDSQCRVDKAVSRLKVSLPSGWKVEVGSGSGPLGMADSGTRTITLWPRDTQSDDNLLFTLYHEVGHAYDFTYLNSSKRGDWADTRGYDPDPWFGCNGCSDFETPAGDWAESFAYCHTGWDRLFASRMGGTPDSGQCGLLRRLAG